MLKGARTGPMPAGRGFITPGSLKTNMEVSWVYKHHSLSISSALYKGIVKVVYQLRQWPCFCLREERIAAFRT